MTQRTGRRSDWLLAQLKPNGADLAERHLRRQGFTVFLPRLPQTRRQGLRFVTRQLPLFPGYVFIAAPEGAPPCLRALNATRGISRLVSFGAAPAKVPAALVAGLMARCDDSQVLVVPPPAPGDVVQLVSGAFADFLGRVERLEADQRVQVLIGLLGRDLRMSVDRQSLRRVG